MLNIKKVEFKDIDTATKNIDLNSVHYKYKEIPAKLFKSKKIELIYINKEEIVNLINEFISTLSKSFNMKIKCSIEYINDCYNVNINAEDNSKLIGKDVNINIVEVKAIDTDAQLVAENIAGQLERRISFRKAMKQCMQKAMKSGALGIKTSVSGRLGGADMARTEFYKEGTIPLQTLRADIDYGFAEANTTYGKIGVKVWIYKGEVLPAKKKQKEGGDK